LKRVIKAEAQPERGENEAWGGGPLGNLRGKLKQKSADAATRTGSGLGSRSFILEMRVKPDCFGEGERGKVEFDFDWLEEEINRGDMETYPSMKPAPF